MLGAVSECSASNRTGEGGPVGTKPAASVRRLGEDDLHAIARVHAAAFPSSVLTQLGQGVVRRYYAWQLNGPHDGEGFGAFVGERLAGFCFGGIFRDSTRGFLRHNLGSIALAVATHPRVLTHPRFRDRLRYGRRALRRPRQHASGRPRPARSDKPYGILSIATDPEAQGRGIGGLLMAAHEEAALRRGFRTMRLTVDADNTQAIRFYTRRGWQKVPSDAEWTGKMEKSLLGRDVVGHD